MLVACGKIDETIGRKRIYKKPALKKVQVVSPPNL
jgi:hypothetical protein